MVIILASSQFRSVAQPCMTLCDPIELQHPRPPCPSPTPGVYSDSCPLSQWSHPIISSCYPLLLPPSIFPSIRVFSDKSVLHIKILEFQVQHQYFQWIFRTDFLWMDWLDLLAFQGTLNSLLQHHILKASILRHSALFIFQLLHPCLTLAGPKAGVTLTAGCFTLSSIWDKWAKRGYHLLLTA